MKKTNIFGAGAQALGVIAVGVSAAAALVGTRLLPALARLPESPVLAQRIQRDLPPAPVAAASAPGSTYHCC
ncbi:MAG: hypothetical protein ABIT82_04665 [Ramlibacter sp.]